MEVVKPITDKIIVSEIAEYFYKRNKRDYIIYMIGICTGLRSKDILNLRVGDVKVLVQKHQDPFK